MKKILVTQEMAREWLANQATNRKLSKTVVDRYTRAMASGSWIASERMPLSFLPDGRLVDGQHRLAALIQCGALGGLRGYCEQFYVTEIEQTQLDLLHECRARSLGDRLAVGGMFEPSVATLAASIGSAIAHRMYHGELPVNHKRHTLTMYGRRPDEIMEAWGWTNCDPKTICYGAKQIYDHQLTNARMLSPTMIGYLLAQQAPGTSSFLLQLCNDSHPDRCTAVITLRRQLGNNHYLASQRLGLVAAAFNNQQSKCLRVFDTVPDLAGGCFVGR